MTDDAWREDGMMENPPIRCWVCSVCKSYQFLPDCPPETRALLEGLHNSVDLEAHGLGRWNALLRDALREWGLLED